MKFYVGEEDLGKVIQRYYRLDNGGFQIKYLSGDEFLTYDANGKYEKKLREEMISQLIERNNNFNIKKETGKYYINFILALLLFQLCTMCVLKNTDNLDSITLLTLASEYGIIKISSEIRDKIDDYYKAKLFLDMRDQLETKEGKEIVDSYYADKIFGAELNVNTLDTFSYKRVEEIYKRVKKLDIPSK